MHITGTDKNTGHHVDKFGCVDAFLPMLLIENAQMMREAGAATESLRNELVKANEKTLAVVRLAQLQSNLDESSRVNVERLLLK